jgi:hypothetical protein
VQLLPTGRAVFAQTVSRLLALVLRMLGAIGLPSSVDPELDRLAERTFAEFRSTPLVEPTRDMSRVVVEQLHKRDETGGQRGGQTA